MQTRTDDFFEQLARASATIEAHRSTARDIRNRLSDMDARDQQMVGAIMDLESRGQRVPPSLVEARHAIREQMAAQYAALSDADALIAEAQHLIDRTLALTNEDHE